MAQREHVRPIILVKADPECLRQTLCRRLDENYDPRPVTATEVLENLDRQAVEALLWTIEGLETDALSLLDRLRERESDLCVILIGPELGAERVSACLRNGAFDYLAMPILSGRLEESLRQGLEIRRSFREVRGLSGQLKTANEELGRERDSLKRLNRSLVLLNQLGQAMSATHEADEIVQIVAEGVPAILAFETLTVTWREPARIWTYTMVDANPHLRPSIGASELSVRRDMAQSEEMTQREKRPTDDSVVDAIDVPLLSRNEEIGRFRLERMQGKPFGPADREFMVTVATSLALSLTNAKAHRNLEQMAMKDGLTGLFNRRAFDQLLNQEIKAAERYRSPVCLLLGDVDHFKAINDRFGHPVGDALLKDVATLLRESLREVDIIARYGGEEFAIILPRTDVASATILADRIRQRIERHVFVIDRWTIRLTLSLGVAGLAQGVIHTNDDLVEAADRALYCAKARGRNCVEIHARGGSPARGVPAYAQP